MSSGKSLTSLQKKDGVQVIKKPSLLPSSVTSKPSSCSEMPAIATGADLRSCLADSKEMGRRMTWIFLWKNVLWLPRWQSGRGSSRVLGQSDVPSAHMDAAPICPPIQNTVPTCLHYNNVLKTHAGRSVCVSRCVMDADVLHCTGALSSLWLYRSPDASYTLTYR